MKEEYAYPDHINKDNVYYLNPNDLDDINEENLFLAFISNNLNVLALPLLNLLKKYFLIILGD